MVLFYTKHKIYPFWMRIRIINGVGTYNKKIKMFKSLYLLFIFHLRLCVSVYSFFVLLRVYIKREKESRSRWKRIFSSRQVTFGRSAPTTVAAVTRGAHSAGRKRGGPYRYERSCACVYMCECSPLAVREVPVHDGNSWSGKVCGIRSRERTLLIFFQ